MVESVYQNVAWLLQRIQSSSSSISNWLKREKKRLRYMKHDYTKKLRFIFITLLFRFIHRFFICYKNNAQSKTNLNVTFNMFRCKNFTGCQIKLTLILKQK